MFRVLLFLLLSLATRVEAFPPVRVTTILYVGDVNTMSVFSVLYMQEQLANFYRKNFKLKLIFKKFLVRKHFYSDCSTLQSFSDYSCWKVIFKDTYRIRSKQRLTLAIVPPMVENGVKWFGGYGDLDHLGYFKGMALAYCSDWNTAGLSRNNACGLVAAHELGHNMGLWHCDESKAAWTDCNAPNFMRSDAGNFVDDWGWDWPVVRYNRKQLSIYFKEIYR